MTPQALRGRDQRIAELMAARRRIDVQLGRMDPRSLLRMVPPENLLTLASVSRLAARARQMVGEGYTHVEIGRALGIRADLVTPLIAPEAIRPGQGVA